MKQSVFFLSYDEKNAEENWERLLAHAPHAKRIHGVRGILNAHRLCAEQSETPLFFVVDGDNKILNFDFSFLAEDEEAIHVWRCRNAVNDLVYGYGAIKLFPRQYLVNAALRVDLATSAAPRYKIMQEIASVTRFNTSPYNAWRAGFRECVKLASQAIRNQRSEETEGRLEAWCSKGGDRPFGQLCIEGAVAGRDYGRKYQNDPAALARINDFDWLAQAFERRKDGTL
jgi:hypothetical protein